jgi:hypothetical protein
MKAHYACMGPGCPDCEPPREDPRPVPDLEGLIDAAFEACRVNHAFETDGKLTEADVRAAFTRLYELKAKIVAEVMK